MMHSSTVSGSMPARRTASRDDQRAELRRGEVLERAEELAGRRPDGADDDDGVTRIGRTSMRSTTSAPSSVCRRLRMVGADRVTSRDHCSEVVSTISVRRSSLTFVARSTAGPTAARHAKPTLLSDNGTSRSSCASAPGNACVSGLNQSPNHQITQSPDVVDPIIAPCA